MTEVWGTLVEVTTANVGEFITSVADNGTTEVYVGVTDVSTFPETGSCRVGVTAFTYIANADAETLTLSGVPSEVVAAGVAVDERIEIWPPLPLKRALVDVGGDEPVWVTVPQTLVATTPEGLRPEVEREAVLVEERRPGELVLKDVSAQATAVDTQIDRTQSATAIEGEEGWIFQADGNMQAKDISALGEVSATAVAADSVLLNGDDLSATLASLPGGVQRAVSKGGLSGKNAGPVTTTELRCFTLDCGDVLASQLYRYQFQGHLTSDAYPSGWDLRVRYSLDGTEATVADPGNSYHRKYLDVANDDFNFWSEFIPPSDGPLSLSLSLVRVSGAGIGTIYQATNTLYKFRWNFERVGPVGAYDNGALSQKIYSDGTGSDNPPITRRTKTYNALWAWGLDVNGNIINDSYFYIGNSSTGTTGNYGLVGFDSATIVAGLSAATTPVSCVLRWRPRTRATATGLDVRHLTHNYASRAAASAAESWPEDWTYSGNLTVRGTTGNHAPNTPYDFSLGTTVFNAFKAGTIKGVGFSNSAADPYTSHPDGTGSIYGNGTSECQMIFTYDGTA